MSYHNPDEGKAPDDKKLVEIVSGFHHPIGEQVADLVRERDELKERVKRLEHAIMAMEDAKLLDPKADLLTPEEREAHDADSFVLRNSPGVLPRGAISALCRAHRLIDRLAPKPS